MNHVEPFLVGLAAGVIATAVVHIIAMRAARRHYEQNVIGQFDDDTFDDPHDIH